MKVESEALVSTVDFRNELTYLGKGLFSASLLAEVLYW